MLFCHFIYQQPQECALDVFLYSCSVVPDGVVSSFLFKKGVCQQSNLFSP